MSLSLRFCPTLHYKCGLTELSQLKLAKEIGSSLSQSLLVDFISLAHTYNAGRALR